MKPQRKDRTEDGTMGNARKNYRSPRLFEYGSLAKLTAGGAAASIEAAAGKKADKNALKP